MHIRPLDAGDAAIYWPVRLRALKEHPDAFGAACDDQRDLPLEQAAARLTVHPGADGFVLGAFLPGDAGSQLVGTIGCFRESGAKAQHKAVIWGMYVAPEARGRGVGRALLGDAITRVRVWGGVRQEKLTVVTGNEAAQALYTAFGFQVYGLETCALVVDGQCLDEELRELFFDQAVPPAASTVGK